MCDLRKRGLHYLLTPARSAMKARTTRVWALSCRAMVVSMLVVGMFAVLWMLVLLALWQLLLDEVAVDELAADVIEHTVNITAAARSAVYLGEVYILVDRDCGRDAREVHQLGNGNLHDNHIHVGET